MVKVISGGQEFYLDGYISKRTGADPAMPEFISYTSGEKNIAEFTADYDLGDDILQGNLDKLTLIIEEARQLRDHLAAKGFIRSFKAEDPEKVIDAFYREFDSVEEFDVLLEEFRSTRAEVKSVLKAA